MEEGISGFKRRGDWSEVVEHGERVTRALRDVGVLAEGAREETADRPEAETEPDGDWSGEEAPDYRRAFEEWDEWRPKAHERLHEDVNQKTADAASVDEGAGEAAGVGPEEDLQTAGEKLADSYQKVEEGDSEGALDRWSDSIDHVARAADSAGRKAIRAVEDTVYRRVMTQMAPYYFDNELISANLQRVDRGESDAGFVFEINVNDDDLKATVSDRLAEYDDTVDRWHVDTEKETGTVESVEGVEPPRRRGDQRSSSN